MLSSSLAETKWHTFSIMSTAGLQAGLGLSRVRSGQDADDLAGQLGVGVGGAGVKALRVNNFAVGLLGGLVKCGVGHIIAVSGDAAPGTSAPASDSALLPCQAATFGMMLGGQDICR